MNPNAQRAEHLFIHALDFQPNERAAFLAGACGSDDALRQRVEALLAAHDRASGFLPAEGGEGADTVLDSSKGNALAHSPDEKEGSLIGRYKLLEKLGEGGFGAVWLAEQKEPVRRKVALKIIKLGMDTKQVVARFEAERQALALMDHPNIAKVLDAGTTETPLPVSDHPLPVGRGEGRGEGPARISVGRPYFVMELVRGIPITKFCDENNMPTRERLDLFIKVCHAIQHAHQKGIIHRDIKPSNVLVTLHDGLPVPKVIDFGIAKATQGELTDKTIHTQFQQFIGTPAYMSPEQAEMSGLDIDTRSDIYSLGVLLYELLTGTTPFDTKELMRSGLDELRRIIREQEPVRPSTRLSQTLAASAAAGSAKSALRTPHSAIDRDLDWIVMKCLEKDRTRRYETANGLAADLQRHLNNEPVVARPPSTAYKFQKAWRRNKVLYTAGATVVLALIGGVLGTSVGLLRADRERNKARASAEQATTAQMRAQAASELAKAQAGERATNLYFERIALAHRESTSEPANVKKAEHLLDQCDDPFRNWEWHYLKRRRVAEPLVLQSPGNSKVHGVAFSPDGRYLAGASGDGKVRIWDLVGAKLIQTLPAHTGFVVSVTFSPIDAAKIATVGSDRQVRLWDWEPARQIQAWPTDAVLDYGMAYTVAFSPDGQRLAAPGETNEVVVRDISTGDIVFKLPGHETTPRCVTFSPTGQWIATGASQGAVRLWDATSGALIEKLGGGGPPIGGVAFTREPCRLIAMHFDGSIRMWDPATRRGLASYSIRAAGAPAVGLAVRPNADRIVTGGLDRLVTVSEPATYREVLVFRELSSGCYCLAFSPDGHRLAAGSRTGSVWVWDGKPLTEGDDPCQRTLHYASDETWALAIAPKGRAIATAGYRMLTAQGPRAPVRIWSSPAFDPPRDLAGHAIVVFTLAYDPTGRFLASAGDETTAQGKARVKVWDVATGKVAFQAEAFEGDGRVFSVVFSHDGRRLVGGGNDKKIKVWDAATGRPIAVIGSHDHEITKLAFSGDGRHLASIGNDDVVKVWDGTNLDRPQATLRRFPGLCGGFTDLISFSPDSTRLAIVTDDDTATVHDLNDANQLVLTKRNHRPLALAFSPNGRWVVSGGVDCTVRFWDARTGALRCTLRSHSDQVTRLSFLQRPEGVWLISSSRDGTVKFWDMAVVERQISSP